MKLTASSISQPRATSTARSRILSRSHAQTSWARSLCFRRRRNTGNHFLKNTKGSASITSPLTRFTVRSNSPILKASSLRSQPRPLLSTTMHTARSFSWRRQNTIHTVLTAHQRHRPTTLSVPTMTPTVCPPS